MTPPLLKNEKLEIRRRLFIHLDGWALIPTIFHLNKLGILDYFIKKPKSNLIELCEFSESNEGYLNIALRILSSQGYLNSTVDNDKDIIQFELTDLGARAFELADNYNTFYNLIELEIVRPRNIISDHANILALENAWNELKHFRDYQNGELKDRMSIHMEGILIGAMMVGFGIENRFEEIKDGFYLNAEKLKISERTQKLLSDILDQMGYIQLLKPFNKLNNKGIYYTNRASAYGVTVSYLPTFARLDTLLTGDPNKLRMEDENGHETHVYRYMNVWGSGGAHSTYFKKVDEIIIELFNKPIEEQPKGIIDVGCGDGSFIEHVFDVIYYKTYRGKILEQHPLFIIGVDYNQKARIATKKTMSSAQIWAEVEFGDISDPDGLNKMLTLKHGINLEDLLNTRTFLDHNRIYKKPNNVNLKCNSTGAFAHRGRRIPNNELFQNLYNHLNAWTPYLKKYGLILVELHSINPKLAAANIGKTLATPYDATHGYTDQYIIELPCFINAAKKAGLKAVEPHIYRFPDNEKATVSIQLLKAE